MPGLDSANRLQLDTRYICSQCELVIRDCVQDEDHRYCRSCHSGATDRAFKRELDSIEISCIICSWTGPYSTYEAHLVEHQHLSCLHCQVQLDDCITLFEHIVIMHPSKLAIRCPIGCPQHIIKEDLSVHYLSQEHQTAIALRMKPVALAVQTSPEASSQVIEALDSLYSAISTLHDDAQSLYKMALEGELQMNEITESTNQVKNINEAHSESVKAMQLQIEILQSEVESYKQKIDDRQYCTFNGQFIWVIPGIASKMGDARSERTTSIYSEPFYSSPTGYKFRMRCYLYGDGTARNTHMSLFIALMRSPYDPILSWPFKYKVTFCLFDQSGQGEHIIESFRPDPRSNSFERPRCDMNIASGIPKFITLEKLMLPGKYIVDNVMFIKCLINFMNENAAVSSEIVRINPGLPEEDLRALMNQTRIADQSNSAN